MLKWLFGRFFILGVIFYLCSPVYAKSTEEELAELKYRILAIEQKLAKQEEKASGHEELSESLQQIKEAFNGISVGAGATFVIQGTSNANGDDLSKNGEDITDASYSVDLELEKEFDDYGKAFIHLETGDSAGVEDELRVFSNVNRDADDSDSAVSVTETWYEHYAGPFTVTGGKIDPTAYIDTNEYANDECAQFLGRIFRNSPTVEFAADNGAGMRVVLALNDFMEVDLLAMDGDGDWEDLFENGFYAGQFNLKPKLFGRAGNYRILGWSNDRKHTKWEDSFKTQEIAYGFGLSVDQELADSVGVFMRYAWQDPQVYLADDGFSLEHAYSVGVQFIGEPWGRDNDVFGLAFGQIFPSDDYKKSDSSLRANTEGHLEAYYSYQVNNHLTVSPDVQVIWNPYGDDAVNGDKTIVVGGVRSQVDF